MIHEITIRSGAGTESIKVTGGVFLVAYDSPANGEETGRSMTIIRATPNDTARAMLGDDGLNGEMVRMFSKKLCSVLYALLGRNKN